MPEEMMTSVQQPSSFVVAPVVPLTLPPSALSSLPVSPSVDESSSRKWWIVAGVLFLIFVGILVWYFNTRP